MPDTHGAGERLEQSMRGVLAWMWTSPYRRLGWAGALCLLLIAAGIGLSI